MTGHDPQRVAIDKPMPPPRTSPFPNLSPERYGVEVLGRDGGRLGRMEDIAVERRTGRIAYALVSVGGFLGFGCRLASLPWSCLKYDAARGAYCAPCLRSDLGPPPNDKAYGLGGWAARRRAREADLYAPVSIFTPPW